MDIGERLQIVDVHDTIGSEIALRFIDSLRQYQVTEICRSFQERQFAYDSF